MEPAPDPFLSAALLLSSVSDRTAAPSHTVQPAKLDATCRPVFKQSHFPTEFRSNEVFIFFISVVSHELNIEGK